MSYSNDNLRAESDLFSLSREQWRMLFWHKGADVRSPTPSLEPRNQVSCLLWSSLWTLWPLNSSQPEILGEVKVSKLVLGPLGQTFTCSWKSLSFSSTFWTQFPPDNVVNTCPWRATEQTNPWVGISLLRLVTSLRWMLQTRPEADRWFLLQNVSAWAHVHMWRDPLDAELLLPPTIQSPPAHKTSYFQVSISVMQLRLKFRHNECHIVFPAREIKSSCRRTGTQCDLKF